MSKATVSFRYSVRGMGRRSVKVLKQCPIRRDANVVVDAFNARCPHERPLPPIPSHAPPTVSLRCARILSGEAT